MSRDAKEQSQINSSQCIQHPVQEADNKTSVLDNPITTTTPNKLVIQENEAETSTKAENSSPGVFKKQRTPQLQKIPEDLVISDAEKMSTHTDLDKKVSNNLLTFN